MELFFSPFSCSLAPRIALYEAGAAATFTEVDPKTKRTLAGASYPEVYALALVPALGTDQGELLTENAAILQYIADRYPGAALAPPGGFERFRLQQWLSFIGTELHKALFVPLLSSKASEEVKAYALAGGSSRLDYLEHHLRDREFLLDAFSVADAYLVTILNWAIVTPVELDRWPSIAGYAARLRKRPSVARAMADERPLYAAELERHRAA